ncbi:BQ2448_6947 [Microbotryum intermedium]|uniref:BQ2448_6947 protein n=1 Tax=Microbotryum intermedium TaxID=269621 RepID=A0A238FGT3_9BASI|nr:BQ2448_6947 [Microbotryum intermedium]
MLRSGKVVLPASWWPVLALLALAASVWASDSDADDPTGSKDTLVSLSEALSSCIASTRPSGSDASRQCAQFATCDRDGSAKARSLPSPRARSTRQADVLKQRDFSWSDVLNAPFLGLPQCLVTWRKGATVAVNWLGPPPGNVSIELVPVKTGTTYTIVSSYPSISQEGYCDGGYGLGVVTYGVECGRVEFKVPSGWSEVGNYSIAVTSLRDDSLVGYTDLIRIVAANSSTSDDAPDGTSVSLLTIPSPTSTNIAASTSFDGTIPSPTAIVTPSFKTTAHNSPNDAALELDPDFRWPEYLNFWLFQL